jgi:hypothetical protein
MSDGELPDAVRDLLDKQAIHEATMRYCRGVDRGDASLVSSVYHPDAFDDHSGHLFTGETVGEGLVEWMKQITTGSTHHITTQTIELDGDTAGCESYYTAFHYATVDGVERVTNTVGRYIDRFERRDGEWKISRRVVILETARQFTPISLAAAGGTGESRRDDADTSYTVIRDRTPAAS